MNIPEIETACLTQIKEGYLLSFNCEDWKGLLNFINATELSGFFELKKNSALEFQEVPVHKVATDTLSSLIESHHQWQLIRFDLKDECNRTIDFYAGEMTIEYSSCDKVKHLFSYLHQADSEKLLDLITQNLGSTVITTPLGYSVLCKEVENAISIKSNEVPF